MPMRLWSLVRSHDATVCSWFRYVTRGAACGMPWSYLFSGGCRCRGAPVRRPLAPPRAVVRSDFTYSMSAITLSSLTSPWNVGISGW